jgi:hypothetical protein
VTADPEALAEVTATAVELWQLVALLDGDDWNAAVGRLYAALGGMSVDDATTYLLAACVVLNEIRRKGIV